MTDNSSINPTAETSNEVLQWESWQFGRNKRQPRQRAVSQTETKAGLQTYRENLLIQENTFSILFLLEGDDPPDHFSLSLIEKIFVD